MSDSATRPDLSAVQPIVGAAKRAERRIRLVRAVELAGRAACVALVAAIVVLVLRKTGVIGERVGRGSLLLIGVGFVVSVLVAYVRRLSPFAGARALDAFHGLADRLSSALAFGAEKEPTPFMQAAIDDALARVPSVDPRRAVPMRAPRDLAAACVFALVLALVALFEVRHHVLVSAAPMIDPIEVTADDLDAMREFLAEVEQRTTNEDTRAAVREFNQLIEDLAAKRLDRTEAFRRMQSLEDKLLEGREGDAKALEEAMKKIGEELKKSELTKPAGEALSMHDLVDAEKQLRDLSKQVRDGKASKEQLDKMREALAKAAKSQADREASLAKRREEIQKDLLHKKEQQKDAGAPEEAEKSLLKKRERELERLQKEQEQAQAAGRQLDRLDRELEKAAEDLAKDLGLSADDLDQSAEDVNRMGKNDMTQEEKEQMRQKLEELREQIRQQGQGGQGQMQRLKRFQQQARGGQSGQGQGQGQEKQQGQGQGEGEGEQQGQQVGKGDGQPGEGQGQGKSGEVWMLGPNGQKMLILTQSRRSGGSGGGSSPKSGGYGTGHDDKLQGGATNAQNANVDTQVAGQDTGQGASRSEVIEAAAERGFASHGYQKVYREYHTVAEETLTKDEVPGGYRFYVRRYFDLIRPREAGDKEK